MDHLSRTTYFGAAGAGGAAGSFVTEFVSDDANEQIFANINSVKANHVKLLSDGSYIASHFIGTSSSQAPIFIKYNSKGEVVEVKRFDNDTTNGQNYAVVGNFVYDESTDIIYFTKCRTLANTVAPQDILAYNWNTETKIWHTFSYVNYADVSVAIGIYDDGDYLLIEACKSYSSATGYRMVSKLRKSDGACIDTWRDNLNVGDSGSGLAGPYAEDSSKRYTMYFMNGTGVSTIAHVFSMAKGTTTFPAPTNEGRLLNIYADNQSRTRSHIAIDGDNVYVAFETATNTFEVAKVNKSTAAVAWTKSITYGSNISPNTSAPYLYNVDIALDSDGNLFTVGMSVRIGTNFSGESNVIIHKFDGSNGNLLWARSIGAASTSSQDFAGATNSIPVVDSNGDIIFGITTLTYSSLTTSTTTDYGVHYLVKMKGDGSEVGDFGPISIMNMDSYSTITNDNFAWGGVDVTRNMATIDTNFAIRATDTVTVTDETNNANFFNNTTEIS